MGDSIPIFGNISYGSFVNVASNNVRPGIGNYAQQVFPSLQNHSMSQNISQSENMAQIQENKDNAGEKKKKKKAKKKKKEKVQVAETENKENEMDEPDENDEGNENEQGIIKASKQIQKKTLKKLLTKAGKSPEELRKSKKRAGKKGPNGKGLDSAMFFKTKICPHFLEGSCAKGKNCTFAHSQSELREVPNLKKTRICQLFQIGKCHLGSSCSYAHGDQELRSTPEFFKTSICNAFMKGSCKLGDRCRYAHGEHELREMRRVPNYSLSLDAGATENPDENQDPEYEDNSPPMTYQNNIGNGFSMGGVSLNPFESQFTTNIPHFGGNSHSPAQKQPTMGFGGFETIQTHKNNFNNQNNFQNFNQNPFSYQNTSTINTAPTLQNSFADIGFTTFNPEKLNNLFS